MKSAIEEIFSGTFASRDDYSSKEGAKATALLFEQEEKLMQYLKDNPEAVEVFRRYNELFSESMGRIFSICIKQASATVSASPSTDWKRNNKFCEIARKKYHFCADCVIIS